MLRDLEISYDGDLIDRVTFKKGQSVRPLWETMLALSPDEMVYWVDRFDFLCPVASEWALAQAFEESAKIKIPLRIQFVRSILNEVNRLIYLTTYLGGVVKGVGLSTSYQQVMILREQVFQKQEELTGGRILPQVLKVGGVRRDLALGDIQKLGEFLKGWKFGWKKWFELVEDDPILESRLEDLLKISYKTAEKSALWGIIGKASGLVYDARLHQPHGAYSQVNAELKYDFELNGDALARFYVAIFEINYSLNLIDQFLVQISSENPSTKLDYKLNPGIFTGSAESAKGPVTAVIEVGSDQKTKAVRVISVGQRIWPRIEELFAASRAEEFDLLWASLGMSAEESEI